MKEEYRRNLPHFQPKMAMFSITLRLNGSIPKTVIEDLKNNLPNRNAVSNNAKSEAYIDTIDDFLDKAVNGPYHLSKPEIAELVVSSIKYRDGKDYKLVCYCIMSNHVHMIIYKLAKPLHIIMKELKSFTGKEANKILKRESNYRKYPININSQSKLTGFIKMGRYDSQNFRKQLNKFHTDTNSRFWQAESFDRIVRDRKDLANKVDYILNNPVKAGLVKNWKEWEWTYCNLNFIDI